MEQIHLKIQKAIEPHSKLIEKIPFFVLVATFFLLPFLFVPSASVPFILTKQTLLFGGIAIALIAWLLLRLTDGRFTIPKSVPFIAFALVPVAVLISFFLSPVKGISLVGPGAEVDSLLAVLFLSSLFFLVPSAFGSKKSVFTLYVAFFAAFILVGLFYAVRILSIANGGSAFSFGIFSDITSNPLGKWNDIALFSGAALILSMFSFHFLRPTKWPKALLVIASIIALLLVAIVNFASVWYVLAIFSLVFIVYSVIVRQKIANPSDVSSPPADEGRRVGMLPILLLIVSAVFIIDGFRAPGDDGRTPVAGWFSRPLNVNQLEVRPSWGSTFDVAQQTIKNDMFFGAGPSRFVSQWLQFKPSAVNTNPFFWDIDFTYGIGLIPTYLVTTGVVGFASWILFFIALCYLGFKFAVTHHDDKLLRYLSVSSFFTAAFLWVFTVIYVPGPVILGLTYLFTAIFITTLYQHENFKTIQFNVFSTPSSAFVGVLVLVLLVLASVSGGLIAGKNLLAGMSFQKALATFNETGDLSQANTLLNKAVRLGGVDLYERSAAELGIVRMRSILAEKGATQEVLQGEFREILSQTIDHARKSTEINPTNYQNWVALGQVYHELVPAIDGAYSQADTAYTQAIALNPHHPALYLLRARLEVANRDIKKAREYIDAALKEKENYAAAIFLLSQIESSEGNVKAAIESAEKASLIAPNDVGVFFQLGLLKYNSRDWKGAVAALERAVGLNPQYANARYFLGLGYHRLGEWNSAIAQFEEIQKTNADNEEVNLILSNLKAGRSPFADARPPVDDRPESREELPVEKGE